MTRRTDDSRSLTKAIEGFIISKRADGISEFTITGYKQHLRLLCEHLGDPPVHAISIDDIRGFLVYMRNEYKPIRFNKKTTPISQHTLANVTISIKSFFKWCGADLGIERPDKDLHIQEYSLPEIIPFTSDELKALLKAAAFSKESSTTQRKPFRMKRPTALRDIAMILVLVDTGLRASEFTRLKIGDLDLDTGCILVRPFGSGRKSRGRVVHIANATRKALWKYLATKEYQHIEG